VSVFVDEARTVLMTSLSLYLEVRSPSMAGALVVCKDGSSILCLLTTPAVGNSDFFPLRALSHLVVASCS